MIGNRSNRGHQDPGWDGHGSASDHLGDLERNFKALLGIEPWIASGLVINIEIFVVNIPGSADAFGDIVAGQFKMDAAGNGVFGPVDFEKTRYFG